MSISQLLAEAMDRVLGMTTVVLCLLLAIEAQLLVYG